MYFTLKLNDYVEHPRSRELADKNDNCTVSDKQPTGKILTLIRRKFCRAMFKPNKKKNTYMHA